MIEPTGKHDEQPRFWPDAERFAIGIARCRDGFHTGSRIQKLQHSAERPILAGRRKEAVSRATLYLTLDHLRGAGLVWMHRFGGCHALYELVYGRQHHDHMRFVRCQNVF